MEPNNIHEDVPGGVPLNVWTPGVTVEDAAIIPGSLGSRSYIVRGKGNRRRSATWSTWCAR